MKKLRIEDSTARRLYPTASAEMKQIPYFTVSPSGFSFYDTFYCCSYSDAGDGSRLCFKNSELAKYAGTQFIDIYKGFMF